MPERIHRDQHQSQHDQSQAHGETQEQQHYVPPEINTILKTSYLTFCQNLPKRDDGVKLNEMTRLLGLKLQ